MQENRAYIERQPSKDCVVEIKDGSFGQDTHERDSRYNTQRSHWITQSSDSHLIDSVALPNNGHTEYSSEQDCVVEINQEKVGDYPVEDESNGINRDSYTTQSIHLECNQINPSDADSDEARKTVQQTNDNQNQGSNVPVQSSHKQSMICAMRLAIDLWGRILLKTIPILSPIIIFMWAYYIPARILTSYTLDDVYFVLYDLIRAYIRAFCYYIAMCLIIRTIYSYPFSKKAIFCVIIPCFVIDVVLYSIPQRGKGWASAARNVVQFAACCLGFYFVKKAPEPLNISEGLQIHYGLTKDGTPMALMKGLIVLFVTMGIFFRYFLPTLISFSLMTQALCRLFIFPLIFFAVKSYQTYVIFDLSDEHMDRRLIVNQISLTHIKFLGRITLSNLSSDGSNYVQYAMVNMLISVAEVVTSVTFKKRIVFFYRLREWGREKVNRWKSKNQVVLQRNYMPSSNLHESGADEERFVKKSFHVRKILMNYEFSVEIIVAIIAPLLMFFLYPIYPDASFSTVSSIGGCFFQIFLQMVFMMAGDLVCLVYDIRNGIIHYDPASSKIELKNKIPIILFSIFCLMHTQFLISLS